jgi:hypothetical protein
MITLETDSDYYVSRSIKCLAEVKPKIMTRTQVKEVSYIPIDIENN